MIRGIGTDIIEVERIKGICEKYGQKFLDRIFTKEEQEYCDSFNDTKYVHYAARFAMKESFSKAIGTGLTQGFKFTEIGIVNKDSGEPEVILTGSMHEKWGKYKIQVSLSHTRENAVAFLIMLD
jgi:holo-[acyl-carrier protein] synthase